MAKFHATRVQKVTHDVSEHQLLRFDSARARDRFVDLVGGTKVTAREAGKLMIADTWRTYSSDEADCVFHAARYMP